MKLETTGVFILLWGVSWAWKNTMMRLLVERHNDYKQLLSYKTRPLREWEKSWIDYNYVTEEEFQKAIEDWVFLEYAKVHNMYYYGTKKTDVLVWLQNNQTLIKEIDVQWIKDIAENHPDIYDNTLRIFLDLSEDIMIERITHRALVTQEELAQRLHSAHIEREQAKKYCQFVVSAAWSIEEVYARVEKCIAEYMEKNT